jgi:hypothetical protein
MKRKLNRIALAVLGAAAGSALAAAMPKEGSYDYIACWSGVNSQIAFSKTHRAFSFEMTGTSRTEPPGGMFDGESFRCVGSNAVFGKNRSAIATCETLDRDGDKRLNFFYLGTDGQYVRETMAGTGKYEGLMMTGKVTPLGPFPTVKPGTFQNCNRQTGTYKMK